MTKTQIKFTTIRITVVALFIALTIAMCSFGIPVPGGHLYLVDVIIVTAAILLNPVEAFIVGGIGSFLGDLIFYPTPMFVSLVTHGVQAVVISVFAHYILKKHPKISSGIGVSIGAIIMVAGYTFGKAFIYSTVEYAILKLPYECAQGILGAVFGMLLVYRAGLKKRYNNIIGNQEANLHEIKKV